MNEEAEIRFENEDLEGIIPVGTYLADAAHRFGVWFIEPCDPQNGSHSCEVEILEGVELLSERTATEKAFFCSEVPLSKRLGCQARIERAGEIVVMTKKKAESEEGEKRTQAEEYRENFARLPLDKKISELVQLEAIAFSDTLSYLINSPFTIGDKIVGAMSEFGFRRERQEREDARPAEHKTEDGSSATVAEEAADSRTKEG